MKHGPRTRFSRWLVARGWTSRLFANRMAEELGIETFARTTVDGWRAGKSTPRLRFMPAIRKITNGEISEADFVEPRDEA